MNSVIIYSSPEPSPDHQLFHKHTANGDITLYLRAELAKGMDAQRALEAARPRPGETLLNTIEV